MPHSRALNSYHHERIALDTALNGPNGIDVPFKDPNRAKYFVGRCNAFRQLSRSVQDKPEDGTIYDLLRISRTDATVHIRYWREVDHPNLIDPITGQVVRPMDVEEIMRHANPKTAPVPYIDPYSEPIQDKPPLTFDDFKKGLEEEIAALPPDQQAAVRKELNIGDDPVDN